MPHAVLARGLLPYRPRALDILSRPTQGGPDMEHVEPKLDKFFAQVEELAGTKLPIGKVRVRELWRVATWWACPPLTGWLPKLLAIRTPLPPRASTR